jgi:protein-S-isoprenylcysteine O-methyltransferase Ste14
MILRHLLAILLLPFVVVVVVPRWLLHSVQLRALDSRWDTVTWIGSASIPTGTALFLSGLALFFWCVGLFVRVGRGTLAPWDPTRQLVAAGPYAHLRNPMITGVLAMLIGEALIFRSWVVAAWAMLFLFANHAYFILSEEPGLERRFGPAYAAYQANVPRWIPRLSPWRRP